MILIKDKKEIGNKKFVATIGFFDGVHLGHRFLIEKMIRIARSRQLPAAVITFATHPRQVLNKAYQPKLLNSFEEKLKHLETTGIDYCILLDFTIELSRLSAGEFIRNILRTDFHIDTLLIGYDHRFGHNRSDGFLQYQAYGNACEIEVLEATAYDSGNTTVSSSEIRRLLSLCQVEEASQLLTYPYQLKGHIVNGYKIGRTLGFPTANIAVDEPYKVLPAVGVYAVWVEIENSLYKGMLYIGKCPTLENGEHMTLEVNILNFAGDIYNKEITVSFIYHIREDIKFSSLDELKQQLRTDRETVDRLLTDNNR
ncbi:MAG: bifunctional riboflavin kinase/FAD synthetase [Tannerellaceae bacterium]|nr:bifunctional riboflavin kinase/FAD synthetase [Tannerellaceae bacterium]